MLLMLLHATKNLNNTSDIVSIEVIRLPPSTDEDDVMQLKAHAYTNFVNGLSQGLFCTISNSNIWYKIIQIEKKDCIDFKHTCCDKPQFFLTAAATSRTN